MIFTPKYDFYIIWTCNIAKTNKPPFLKAKLKQRSEIKKS